MDFDDDVQDESIRDEEDLAGKDKGPFGSNNPLDVSDPGSAYLFLSDDAQDELGGDGYSRRMRCLTCGKFFRGDILAICPECSSSNVVRAD